jgi:hypothetical protein
VLGKRMSVCHDHFFPGARDERDEPAVSALARDHERPVAGVPQEVIAPIDTKIPKLLLRPVAWQALRFQERGDIPPEGNWLLTLPSRTWWVVGQCR